MIRKIETKGPEYAKRARQLKQNVIDLQVIVRALEELDEKNDLGLSARLALRDILEIRKAQLEKAYQERKEQKGKL